MKLSQLFRTKRPQVGWQGHGGEPSPFLIGGLVAVVMAGVYAAIVLFGPRG